MKIGVISDTHAATVDDIPRSVMKALETVDLIVHAGDFTEEAVLAELKAIGQVKAVCGNMDSRELKKILPQTALFTVNEKRIGLVHGSGGPWGIEERIRKLFTDVDIIIFGHSHQTCNKYLHGALMFNPGSARNTFGIITVEDRVKSEILKD